jgi:asparagine synthase (glutamine-hydrolysing)
VLLFAVTYDASGADESAVAGALRDSARAYRTLSGRSAISCASPSGRLALAAVSPPEQVAAPRRHLARAGGTVVAFDGLPVHRTGAFPGHDAAQLLSRWQELPEGLEGIFSAVRVTLDDDTVECLTDVLGMAHVYLHHRAAGWVLSNRVEPIRRLSPAQAPDPIGVASLLAGGAPAADRTLLSDTRVLAGGCLHRLSPSGVRSRPHLTASTVAPRRQRGAPRSAGELARALTATAAAAARGVQPLSCALTAGRDTRVLAALARAAGWDAGYYTVGAPADVDVQIARELAAQLSVAHRVIAPPVPSGSGDWAAATGRFVAHTDGLASVAGIDDWLVHQLPVQRLGLELWGAGGEIGRGAHVSRAIRLTASAPGLRWSLAAQRRALNRTVNHWGLLRPQAVEIARAALEASLRARVREGWRRGEAREGVYTFERVRRWAAAGVRRAAEATDLYSPFVSRDFIQYSYSLRAAERLVEAPHWRLLGELSPQLRDLRFESRWRPQRPRRVTRILLAEAIGLAAARARAGRGAAADPLSQAPFRARWLEAGLDTYRELVSSAGDSELWELIDRGRLEAVLSGTLHEREGRAGGLCTVLTVLWHFHGPPTPAA